MWLMFSHVLISRMSLCHFRLGITLSLYHFRLSITLSLYHFGLGITLSLYHFRPGNTLVIYLCHRPLAVWQYVTGLCLSRSLWLEWDTYLCCMRGPCKVRGRHTCSQLSLQHASQGHTRRRFYTGWSYRDRLKTRADWTVTISFIDRFCIALFSALQRLTVLMLHVILNEWLRSFYFLFFYNAFCFNIHRSGAPTALFGFCKASAT